MLTNSAHLQALLFGSAAAAFDSHARGRRELKQRLSEYLDRAERGAAQIAEVASVRTLDALHLAAAQRIGGPAVPFLTFDVRQAQAARALGLTVVGV